MKMLNMDAVEAALKGEIHMKKFLRPGRIWATAVFIVCSYGAMVGWNRYAVQALMIATAISWALMGYGEGLEDGKELS
jgi:hypothetical protein